MNPLRTSLFPFALLYDGVTRLRNTLFDRDVLKSELTSLPSIGVGNLSMGGSGKSVVIDFLLEHFKRTYKVAVLSRGYKRTTKGFLLADAKATAHTIGDEPFQFYTKYPECTVAVCEDRRIGIQKLAAQNPAPDLVLLDDVLQHRWVVPQCMVLTTPYDLPYARDWVFPMGNLREARLGAKRAAVVLVTKCPEKLPENIHEKFRKELKLSERQHLFFTKVVYSKNIRNAGTQMPLKQLQNKPFVLVTGIANPAPLVTYLKTQNVQFRHLSFPDHHRFRSADLHKITKEAKGDVVLTTEKDYGRLQPLLKEKELFYLPIEMDFVFEKEKAAFLKVLEGEVLG